MSPREENPLEYVGVSEAACQRRTKEITIKIDGVGSQVSSIDKKLDVHLASLQGADKAGRSIATRLKILMAVISMLIAFGGIVWGAAKLAQPDVKAIAAAVKANP
jgi:hypothetical protein